ncbi:hypothetical protein [Streptomyces sp. NBC_01233]|uniref:hypothetical protein n=1 Tax=Streptomyces sp. NBC_01233 TaxID=2903787 RepID=UPI002E0F67D8|nr:hypothetical protein OG332_05170 [Streptomyces sp. NBC_01233]
MRPDQLRDSVLWAPGALDRLDFLHRFADRFDIQNTATSINLGLAHFLAEVAQEPRGFSLVPADVPLPKVPGLRSVPLVDPTPLYGWSLLWRTGSGHPGLKRLTAACAEEAGRSRWLEYDPTRDWLPEPPTSGPGPGSRTTSPKRPAPAQPQSRRVST